MVIGHDEENVGAFLIGSGSRSGKAHKNTDGHQDGKKVLHGQSRSPGGKE
jgi:hypothetical protein